MNSEYSKANKILDKYNQNHVKQYLKFSDGSFNCDLIKQILNIDFEELKELYNKTFEDLYVDLEELQPIVGINPNKISQEKLKEYEAVGVELIKNNKFAVSTMAGGQGTRLRI